MKKLFIFLAAAGMLNACTKDTEEAASPSPYSSARLSVTKPFKGSFYTTVDPNPAFPLTFCSGDVPNFAVPGIFIHGNATHLGELISDQSRIQDETCNLSVSTMLLTTHGSGQLAANNGDLIYVTWDDEIDASAFITQTGTTGTITGTWTITGGTGRFEGASGSFEINGPVDFLTTSFQVEAKGTITY